MPRFSPTTLSGLLGAYVKNNPALRPGARQQLAVAVHVFEAWAGGAINLGQLSRDLILGFMAEYGASHSPATVNSKVRAIKTLWRWAHSEGAIHDRPEDFPRLSEPLRVPLAWKKHEVERLICHARTLSGEIGEIPRRFYWPSLIVAEYWTGCRIWALLHTATADLSMSEGYLIVRAEFQKTNRDRFFSLPDQAVAAIAAHWCPHRKRVWPWPYCRRYFWTAFRRIVEDAGLSSSKRGMDLFHKLRRTCLSYAAAAGDIGVAQRQAGHSNPQMTIDRYIDPSIAPQQSAASVLPALDL